YWEAKCNRSVHCAGVHQLVLSANQQVAHSRGREQGSAQSATDEVRSQTKVHQLDLLITAAAQLEVAGALIADEQFPDRDIGRREVRTKCVVIPCEPVAPVPGPTDGLIEPPIVSERARIATHDARPARKRSARLERAGPVDLE